MYLKISLLVQTSHDQKSAGGDALVIFTAPRDEKCGPESTYFVVFFFSTNFDVVQITEKSLMKQSILTIIDVLKMSHTDCFMLYNKGNLQWLLFSGFF